MRVITWNMKRATESSEAWRYLRELKPDVALLQEVGQIPSDISACFDSVSHPAINKKGGPQRFNTAVLVKGKVVKGLSLFSTGVEWMDNKLSEFGGNIISCVLKPVGHPALNAVSIYSPAWLVHATAKDEWWLIDVLVEAMKNTTISSSSRWIFGGDFNGAETFDGTFSYGEVDLLANIAGMGFKECLKTFNTKSVPTFKNPKGGKVIHQIDHLFVTNHLYAEIVDCRVGEGADVFGKSLSDHLPIIADFR